MSMARVCIEAPFCSNWERKKGASCRCFATWGFVVHSHTNRKLVQYKEETVAQLHAHKVGSHAAVDSLLILILSSDHMYSHV